MEARSMQCMEVWGGNVAVNNGVVMPGLDAWVYSRPRADERAGGDIHYVSSCATGRITRALVADVSGHGESVAPISETLRDLMRRYVNYIDQRHVIDELNKAFGEIGTDGRFATAVVVTYWTPTDDVEITSAGHPPPLLFRSKGGGWEPVEHERPDSPAASDTPLGVIDTASYQRSAIHLHRNDLVVLYTDALIEARRADGSQLGVNGLLGIVSGLDPSEPAEFVDALVQQIEASDLTPSDDDMTILVLRPNAMKPRGSFRVGVKATVDVFISSLRSLVRRGESMPFPERRLVNLSGAFFDRPNKRNPISSGGDRLHR